MLFVMSHTMNSLEKMEDLKVFYLVFTTTIIMHFLHPKISVSTLVQSRDTYFGTEGIAKKNIRLVLILIFLYS